MANRTKTAVKVVKSSISTEYDMILRQIEGEYPTVDDALEALAVYGFIIAMDYACGNEIGVFLPGTSEEDTESENACYDVLATIYRC
jgi:hypothetical protein